MVGGEERNSFFTCLCCFDHQMVRNSDVKEDTCVFNSVAGEAGLWCCHITQ